MKHIRILLSLLIVVVVAMAGIFFVEGYTTPIIQQRLDDQANAALYEMFGVDPENTGSYVITNVTEEYPEDAFVKEVFTLSDGSTQVGVVYKAETPGYNPGIVFMMGVSIADNNIAGYSTIANGETAGLGKDLLEDPAFAAQFVGAEIDVTRDNGVDVVSGSTARMTLGGINKGIKNVLVYHGVNFLGEEAPVIETPDQAVERLQGEWFNGATLTDVYSNYEQNDLITEVYEADGGYFIKAIYVGFEQSQISTFVIGIKDSKVLGFYSYETFETEGIGADLVMHPDFAAQFVGVDVSVFAESGADFVAGSTATYTLDGINDTIMEVMDFYNKQIVGIKDEEAPVLEVNTARPTTFEVGSEAPNWELYVTGTDNEDDVVVVENNASTVDFNTAGTYTVTFTASDAAGNAAVPVEVVIEITDAPVEFVLVPAPAELLTDLATLSSDDFHDEGITTDLINGVYTGRDSEGNITTVVYDVTSDNGTWTGNNVNSIFVQFNPGSSEIVKVFVYDNSATYYSSDFAPNYNQGEDFDSEIIANAWVGISSVGGVTEGDLDTVSGTTAEASFPSMIESIEHVITYQIENSIGGAN